MFFSAETIKDFSQNFFQSGFQLNSKLEHDEPIEGVTFVESWLVENPKVDKSAAFGLEYPKGSWLVSMKVDNDDIWNNYIKTGELKGFSIDGMVELEEVTLKSNIEMSKNNKNISSIAKTDSIWSRARGRGNSRKCKIWRARYSIRRRKFRGWYGCFFNCRRKRESISSRRNL